MLSLLLAGGFLAGLFFTFLVVSAVLNGWALSILWGWFIVPTLGLPQISVAQAIGIAAIVRLLTYRHVRSAYEEEEDTLVVLAKELVLVILQPFVVLLFGWIVRLFM